MKKLISIVSTFSIIASIGTFFLLSNASAAVINPSVKLDGKIINFPDTLPYINEANRTLVPIRFVSEALNCKVNWEDTNQMVTIDKDDKRILLQIGENWAIIKDARSDIKKEFDTAAVLKNDRTMVPLRFISETLGCDVKWDEQNSTAIIKSSGVSDPVATPTPVETPAPTVQPSPTPTLSPKEYKSPKDNFKGVELTDPVAKAIYNLGYYVSASGSSQDGGFGITFTDKPDGNPVFGISISQFNINIDLNVVTPLSKEMLYKTLKIIYPENYEKYYAFYMKRINNREAGNRFEDMDGFTFHTNLMTVPYYTMDSNIYPSNN